MKVLLLSPDSPDREPAEGRRGFRVIAAAPPRLDMKILALTLVRRLARQGISQPGHATAEEFMGSKENACV